MVNDVTLKELDLIIKSYYSSETFKDMEIGDRYYKGKHDILYRKKYGIGQEGEKVELKNIANYKIVDNQFASILEQKINYILSKDPSFVNENKEYVDELKKILNANFLKLLFLIGKDCYKYGISFLYVYYNENGKLSFKKFDSREIIPIWKDSEHLELDYVIRIYKTKTFENGEYKEKSNVEIYTKDGIKFYEYDNGLIPLNEEKAYININDNLYNWQKLPIIPFKANEDEIPLIKKCKTIQDAINELMSDFRNDMDENARNTILIVKNYGNVAEDFRTNLNKYGYIAIENDGGVEALKIDVNADNYKEIISLLKKAMYENAKGFDAKNDKLGSNPNEMNIQSMYSDIDLDANGLEREFKSSFSELLWFINQHFLLTKKVDYTEENVEIVFNRDILINESQAIDDCVKSLSILSKESVIGQHPWVRDIEIELEKIKKQEDNSYENIEDDFEEHIHE